VQVVDGQWRLEADGVRTTAPYYDRVLSIGDASWTNYETTVRLTVHDFTPSAPGPPTYNVTHFGVAMRWGGHHADGLQPSRRWFPLGRRESFCWQRTRVPVDGEFSLTAQATRSRSTPAGTTS